MMNIHRQTLGNSTLHWHEHVLGICWVQVQAVSDRYAYQGVTLPNCPKEEVAATGAGMVNCF